MSELLYIENHLIIQIACSHKQSALVSKYDSYKYDHTLINLMKIVFDIYLKN